MHPICILFTPSWYYLFKIHHQFCKAPKKGTHIIKSQIETDVWREYRIRRVYIKSVRVTMGIGRGSRDCSVPPLAAVVSKTLIRKWDYRMVQNFLKPKRLCKTLHWRVYLLPILVRNNSNSLKCKWPATGPNFKILFWAGHFASIRHKRCNQLAN